MAARLVKLTVDVCPVITVKGELVTLSGDAGETLALEGLDEMVVPLAICGVAWGNQPREAMHFSFIATTLCHPGILGTLPDAQGLLSPALALLVTFVVSGLDSPTSERSSNGDVFPTSTFELILTTKGGPALLFPR